MRVFKPAFEPESLYRQNIFCACVQFRFVMRNKGIARETARQLCFGQIFARGGAAGAETEREINGVAGMRGVAGVEAVHAAAVVKKPSQINFGDEHIVRIVKRCFFGKQCAVFVSKAMPRKDHIAC